MGCELQPDRQALCVEPWSSQLSWPAYCLHSELGQGTASVWRWRWGRKVDTNIPWGCGGMFQVLATRLWKPSSQAEKKEAWGFGSRITLISS